MSLSPSSEDRIVRKQVDFDSVGNAWPDLRHPPRPRTPPAPRFLPGGKNPRVCSPRHALVCYRLPMLLELLLLLGLVLLNGVLAGAEIAIVSLRRTRLQELVESGSGAARAVQKLREQPERFLATVQIGITVVGA